MLDSNPRNERTNFLAWLNANPPMAGTTEIGARYYNTGDLGVGRDMHCWFTDQGASCYVSNFGASFVGNPPATQEEALQQTLHHEVLGLPPAATVAMAWREVCPIVNGQPDCTIPHPHEDEVQFFTFGPDGQRINEVQLDSEGEKPVPGNCITCHGGTYDLVTHKVKNANFLPFDTCAFAFSSEHGWTLADQQHDFQQLNLLVWITQPEERNGGGITEFLEGVYRVGNQPFGTDIQDERWVPSLWQSNLDLPRFTAVRRTAEVVVVAAPVPLVALVLVVGERRHVERERARNDDDAVAVRDDDVARLDGLPAEATAGTRRFEAPGRAVPRAGSDPDRVLPPTVAWCPGHAWTGEKGLSRAARGRSARGGGLLHHGHVRC